MLNYIKFFLFNLLSEVLYFIKNIFYYDKKSIKILNIYIINKDNNRIEYLKDINYFNNLLFLNGSIKLYDTLSYFSTNLLENNLILEIEYTINSKKYKYNTNIKTCVDLKFPFYNKNSLSKMENKITSISIENNEDILDEIMEYLGPNKNFYLDIIYNQKLENIFLKSKGIFLKKYLESNSIILLEDIYLNEYKIYYPFNKKITLKNRISI